MSRVGFSLLLPVRKTLPSAYLPKRQIPQQTVKILP